MVRRRVVGRGMSNPWNHLEHTNVRHQWLCCTCLSRVAADPEEYKQPQGYSVLAGAATSRISVLHTCVLGIELDDTFNGFLACRFLSLQGISVGIVEDAKKELEDRVSPQS